jgi:acyl carrier protein
MSENELISLVISWVQQNNIALGAPAIEVTPETDLIAAGALNSIGFVDLLLFLETRTASTIDLTDIDPAEFCVVKNLCRFLQSCGRASVA